MFWKKLTILVMLLLSAPAFAKTFEVGYKKYTSGDFRGAESAFAAALKRDKSPTSRGKSFKYLGITQYMLGKNGPATASFKRALQLNPATVIDKNEVLDETILSFFGKIKNQNKKPPAKEPAAAAATEDVAFKAKFGKATKTTYLRINSNVKTATVTIDGILSGGIGQLMEADPGTVIIQLDAPGFLTKKIKTNIVKNQENILNINLEKRKPKPAPAAKVAKKPAAKKPVAGKGEAALAKKSKGKGKAAKGGLPDPGGEELFTDNGSDVDFTEGRDLAEEFAQDTTKAPPPQAQPLTQGPPPASQAAQVRPPVEQAPAAAAPNGLQPQPYNPGQPVYPQQPYAAPQPYAVQDPYVYPQQSQAPQMQQQNPGAYQQQGGPPAPVEQPLAGQQPYSAPPPPPPPQGQEMSAQPAYQTPPPRAAKTSKRKVGKRRGDKSRLLANNTVKARNVKRRPASSRSGGSIFISLLPFGAGQFQNGSYILGSAFAASEVLAVYFWYDAKSKADKEVQRAEEINNDDEVSDEEKEKFIDEANAYVDAQRRIQYMSMFTFYGLWIGGATEAILNAPTPKPTRKLSEAADPAPADTVLAGPAVPSPADEAGEERLPAAATNKLVPSVDLGLIIDRDAMLDQADTGVKIQPALGLQLGWDF